MRKPGQWQRQSYLCFEREPWFIKPWSSSPKKKGACKSNYKEVWTPLAIPTKLNDSDEIIAMATNLSFSPVLFPAQK